MGSTHGAFSWVGLLTRDLEHAGAFYGELFGWTTDAAGMPGSDRCRVVRLRGEPVALMYEIADWQRELGAPVNWASFVSVDDVDASAARAVELGGGVAIAPYYVAGAARIAVVTDPSGTRLSLWQSLTDVAPVRGLRAGACCWNELSAADPDAAAAFYTDLFGWELHSEPNGYRIVTNAGVAQGGIRALGASEPRRPRWLPYFRVGSVGDVLDRCAEIGGRVAEPPSEGPVAVLRDAEGACFGVCTRLPSRSGVGSASGGESAAPAA